MGHRRATFKSDAFSLEEDRDDLRQFVSDQEMLGRLGKSSEEDSLRGDLESTIAKLYFCQLLQYVTAI